MKIGLIDVDSKIPNLALMKISAYHKSVFDFVEWYNPFDYYDIVYMSKVFTFTPDYDLYIKNATQIIQGGTGYNIKSKLPKHIEFVTPDYSIYPNIDSKTSYGFLTRGCPNKCKWCIVPIKEGKPVPYMDIEEIVKGGRKNAILMDNNILSLDYGIKQIEKIIKLGIRVDFNQALDARLVDDDIAKLLAKVKWLKRIRFGCDTPKQIQECQKAIDLITKHGYKGEVFLYCILLDDFKESFERINYWKNKGSRFIPHAQPFRDVNKKHQIIPQWQNDMARWVNRKELFKTLEFKDYVPRKGFKCEEYFL